MQAMLILGTACFAASFFTLTSAGVNTETSSDAFNENTKPITESSSASVGLKTAVPQAFIKLPPNNKERIRLQLSTAHPNDVAHPSEATSGKTPPDGRGHPNEVPEAMSEARELENATLEWPDRPAHYREPKGRPTSPAPPQGFTLMYDLESQRATGHPCLRECEEGAPPMTCRFRFEMEWYHSMSKACYNCPHNVTDCQRQDCITADGFKRPLIVVNRQMPGPSVEVCHGDHIVVDLVNHMSEESTTIHWHGHHQRGTPYMDGVPYVTQCPIPPRSTFRYRYQADTPGTHFWHSHSGSQRADGAYGSLIVRVPTTRDPNRGLYDRDLPSHTIQIMDWDHTMGVAKFLAHHHADGDNKPPTLLVNGVGRHIEFIPQPGGEQEGPLYIPTARFYVEQGLRYRFRLINAGFLNCPIQLSVDNHNLTIIASDGSDLEPVEAESLVTYAGERFDFVISANQTVDNYWIRLRGLMDCDRRFSSAHQVAVLRYNGAPDKDPEEAVSYDAADRTGVQVNALNAPMDANDSYIMPEMNAAVNDDVSLKPEADFTFYISYDFYAKDNPTYHKPSVYGFHQVVNRSQRLYTPQLNHITMRLPTAPPLSQPEDLNPDLVCNSSSVGECTTRFCECTHILRVPLGAVVELVIVDIGVTFDANHPFHLHGTAFRVIAMDRLGSNTTVDEVKELDRAGLIKRKLHKAPIKDTVTVPDGGYTIIRFHATNPGFWLLHCHIEFHVEMGMAIIFQVGDPTEFPPVPQGFPRCGNYVPPEEESEIEVVELNGTNKIRGVRQKFLFNLPPQYMVPPVVVIGEGFWFFHCHIGQHVLRGMALIFQFGELEDLPPLPLGFPTCGKDFITNEEDNSETEVVTTNGTSMINYVLQKIIVLFSDKPPIVLPPIQPTLIIVDQANQGGGAPPEEPGATDVPPPGPAPGPARYKPRGRKPLKYSRTGGGRSATNVIRVGLGAASGSGSGGVRARISWLICWHCAAAMHALLRRFQAGS